MRNLRVEVPSRRHGIFHLTRNIPSDTRNIPGASVSGCYKTKSLRANSITIKTRYRNTHAEMTKLNIQDPAAAPIRPPTFKEWAKTKVNKTWRSYVSDTIVKTPVFENVKLKRFNKKSEKDSDALVVYFNVQCEDELAFVDNSVRVMEDATKQEMKKRVKDLYNKKDMSSMVFKSSYNDDSEYVPSFKTSICLQSDGTPINCEFFDEEGSRMDYRDVEDAKSFSARAVIEFTHAYGQADKSYGCKSCVRVLQMMKKPEGVARVNEDKEPATYGEKAPLGLCF